jgi:hypothetical protein
MMEERRISVYRYRQIINVLFCIVSAYREDDRVYSCDEIWGIALTAEGMSRVHVIV